jgi:sn-glycerol 3-phosphate transport system ATP-binding protein
MRIEIRRLHQAIRTTAIYVTHDQVEAMTLADRLIVMNAGRAEQIGSPLDVYARPPSTFVAGFIGAPAMNLLPARLDGAGAAVALDGAALRLGRARAGEGGREVTLGIRPEHIAPDPGGALSLAVELVEALGADTLIHGKLAQGGDLTVRLPGTARVTEGDRIALGVPPEAIHLFDPAGGARL